MHLPLITPEFVIDFQRLKESISNKAKAIENIGFSVSPSSGTYFQLPGYEELAHVSDKEFVTTLTKDGGLAAIPVSVFYEDPPRTKFIRFCFAKEDATLLEAAERLRAYFA